MNSDTLAVRADSPLITHENSNQVQSFYQCCQQRGNPCIGKHVDQKCLKGLTSPNSRNSLACDRPTIFRVSTILDRYFWVYLMYWFLSFIYHLWLKMLPFCYPNLRVLSCRVKLELDDSIYFLYNFVMLYSPKHILVLYFPTP